MDTKEITRNIRERIKELDAEKTKLDAALVSLAGRRGRRSGSKNKPRPESPPPEDSGERIIPPPPS
jgi:hypothetical protein